MSRIAIYARFSTDKQSDSSIEDQVQRAREWLRNEGHDPDAAQVFPDFAVSGASMDRPGMQGLLAALKAGTLDLVVAESIDRISRDVGDLDRLRKELAHHGVELVCLDGTRLTDGDRSSALLFGVRSLFAEQYLADLSDKTLRGLEGRARSGKATGGAPYGYRLVKGESGAIIEIDPERAAIVRRIFADYARGRSFAAIARSLNAEGIVPPRALAPHSTGVDGYCGPLDAPQPLLRRALGVRQTTVGEATGHEQPGAPRAQRGRLG